MPSRFWSASGNALLPSRGFFSAGAASVPLSLNFATSSFQAGVTTTATLSTLPGYTYTRTGAKNEVTGSSAPAFAANAPALVTGYGLWSRDSQTNLFLMSQAIEQSPWTSGSTVTIAINNVTAPDGTVTADTITTTTASSPAMGQAPTVAASTAYTFSTFIPAGGTALFAYFQVNLGGGPVASFVTLDRTTGAVSANQVLIAGVTLTAYSVAVGTGWRFITTFTVPASMTTSNLFIGTSETTATRTSVIGKTMPIWQTQLVQGTYADGGPIIPTTTATVTIGADALAVGVANGTYTATYTFDNNSTQTIGSTVIAAGSFAMPTNTTTLTRPLVKSVVLV